ncbi:hypothetical protein NDU88_005622 [Pleurodeles waltl]|uniref:Myb/SANT-like DNA-binding domain-containing protein n=1 Tax=Pleurodeles waltl TaxID=8319 RepID=A0AAV7TW21_PLEWA|nr:hypothetical protein NDU88_005622 [Pleurodeles waltl]
MVEEIVRVEPQLFGAQVQHTTIARKMELWQRIVDRVNAVGQHPRNRDDIRKRWNDLRGKIVTTLRDHVAPQRAPVTNPDQEQPTTSAGASGQEAPTQQQATRTPPPAEEEPPRKWNLRSHKKTE